MRVTFVWEPMPSLPGAPVRDADARCGSLTATSPDGFSISADGFPRPRCRRPLPCRPARA
jgi:hypothetical protein